MKIETTQSVTEDPDEAVEKDRHIVTALGRGLRVLRCFSHERPELSANDIVRMTGLPQPTVWRLCRTLASEGLIVCAGEPNRMALGLPVLALGYAALARQPLARLAMPAMQALTERLQLGTSLAAPVGLEMVYIQRTHGDFVYFNDPVGSRRPLATAPTGWACLAAWDEARRAETLKEIKRQGSKAFPALERRIRAAIDHYHLTGFITSIGVLHEHFNAVAVPVRGADGQVHGLSASGIAALWPEEKLKVLGAELVALARDLSAPPETTTKEKQ
ncbi:MAG TPA: IclR family transcriptional regulator [Ramlibacter sp.]|nr:IclR family transcriptional regulator [Ramlibacter sp.]